ncbi:MAG TPA: ATP-binding protein [Haliangiales bacterium]|nr:ATP-binding protein [Haliangiales bacterium]
MIRLQVPSRLEYRDLAIRMVASACKLVPNGEDEFYDEVISAFGEAFNNVVMHSYGSEGGQLEIEIEPGVDRLTIRLKDYGKTFDVMSVPSPNLDTMPESGLGVFILRSFMDDVTYSGGSPNVLSMTKYLKADTRKP